MKRRVKIGTRESQLAIWQATEVQNLLTQNGVDSDIIFIKSEGDIDTITPLYEIGVMGIFTKTLDAALLNGRIDIAVHSMKDVPTQMAMGVRQAAVLKRASYKDILVFKEDKDLVDEQLNLPSTNASSATNDFAFTVATSSTRRKAQWLNRYPEHRVESLRGNVNTRLRKLTENEWNGAIFAAAGLERINLRPEKSLELDWMLPAPAQGAITISCRTDDAVSFDICNTLNDEATDICTKIERDFLKALLGGCSTPISALARVEENNIIFQGNICSPDGKKKLDIQKVVSIRENKGLGTIAANELLQDKDAQQIIFKIQHAGK